MKAFRVGVAATVLAASLLAGCATRPPADPSVPPTSAVTETNVGSPAPTDAPPTNAPPTGTFAPVAMPWPGDDGPVLWPLTWDSGATDELGSSSGVTRYGFLDESAREVVSPLYLRFDYCLSNGRPSQIVAAREGAIDVLALDGSVTRTIKTSQDVYGLLLRDIWCRDNLTVAAQNEDGWDEYDLATGTKLAKKLDSAVMCRPMIEEPPLPDGYPNWEFGGWASDSLDEEAVTKYINLQTSAVVTPSPTTGTCQGASGYLNCQSRSFSTVYDSSGQLTDFATVVAPNMGDCSSYQMPDPPYLWAVAGRVQGYIDRTNAWHYQMSAYTASGE